MVSHLGRKPKAAKVEDQRESWKTFKKGGGVREKPKAGREGAGMTFHFCSNL